MTTREGVEREKKLCSNFSAISAQLTRKGLLESSGELIDLWDKQAHEGLENPRQRIAEKMVGNGRERLIDLEDRALLGEREKRLPGKMGRESV